MKARFAAVAAALFALSAAPVPAQADELAYQPCDARCPEPAHALAGSRTTRKARVASPTHGRPSAQASHPSYVVRQTALGPIEVAPGTFADKAVGVANDLAAAGYKVRIKCRSFANSHVDGSLHKRSRACDVCQGGWGKTCVPRAVLTSIVVKRGLRDGCEFADWGHFDDGPHLVDVKKYRHLVVPRCGLEYVDAVRGKRHLAGAKAEQ